MRPEESEKWVAEYKEMVRKLQAQNQEMKAENQEMKAEIIRRENENEELRGALQRLEANVELMKQIPCEWKVDGKTFTSFEEAQTWFLSQNYDQGTNDTNTTASAADDPMDLDVESFCSDIQYTDECVQDFIEKLDDKEKSRVDFLAFKGLSEELKKCERSSLPPSLVPIHEILIDIYGDITAKSNQCEPVITDSYILFCSVIKDMKELQLEQVNLDKMILWRDAINSGLSIDFKGNFAIKHLKKIARAYYGSKAQNDQELKSLEKSSEERISELKAKLYALEENHSGIIERQSSELRQECLRDHEYFQGKPLSTGLFLS